eukprot:gene36150-48666_t
MAPAPKKSKKVVESINSKIQLVMKSGKTSLGYKTTIKSLRSSKAKMRLLITGDHLFQHPLIRTANVLPFNKTALIRTKGL